MVAKLSNLTLLLTWWQLFNGNTVLEAIYLLNASRADEYQFYTNAYADLQMDVLRLLAGSKGSQESQVTALIGKAREEVLEVIAFEADLANVSCL